MNQRIAARRGLWIVTALGLAWIGCGDQQNPASKGGAPSAGAGASASAKGAKRIILLTNGNSPFWDACRAGMQDAEKELKLADAGLTTVMEVNDGTAEGQLDKLRQFATQTDVAGVGVSAIDASNAAIANQMKELQAKGVQVVTIDSDVDREKMRDARYAFIGTDNLAGGKELGVTAKNLRPEGGSFVTFVGRTGAQNAIERVGGFAQGAGEKFKSLDNMADDVDTNRARENVRNALKNHPSLNTLVGIWSYNAPAIVDVVKEKSKRKDVTIVVFDAEPLAISAMKENMIDAMVVQNPHQMGFQGVKMLKALVQKDDATLKAMLPKKGEKDGDIFDTGLKVVVPSEKSPLKKEMFQSNTQFLLLADFEAWLKKYNLTGS